MGWSHLSIRPWPETLGHCQAHNEVTSWRPVENPRAMKYALHRPCCDGRPFFSFWLLSRPRPRRLPPVPAASSWSPSCLPGRWSLLSPFLWFLPPKSPQSGALPPPCFAWRHWGLAWHWWAPPGLPWYFWAWCLLPSRSRPPWIPISLLHLSGSSSNWRAARVAQHVLAVDFASLCHTPSRHEWSVLSKLVCWLHWLLVIYFGCRLKDSLGSSWARWSAASRVLVLEKVGAAGSAVGPVRADGSR